MYDQIKGAILRILVEKVPPLREPSARWTRISRKIRLEVNVKDPGVFSARVQLPQGAWIPELLRGDISLTENSYFTISPIEGFSEVEFDGADSRLIRAVGQCLRVPASLLRALLNTSIRAAFNSECAMTRISTSLFIRGGKGQRSSVRYFTPDSDEAGLVVGLEAMVLLVARRSGPTITLRLGGNTPLGAEFPVTVEVNLPSCPSRPLYDMVSPQRATPLQLRPAQTRSESSVALLGPLPKGWLQQHIGPAAAKVTAAEEFLEKLFQSHLQANTLVLIGRYDKGGDPIGLYIEFQSITAANRFADRLYASSLPEAVVNAINMLIPGITLEVYSCNAPAEALALLREKDLMAIFEKGRMHPCGPPAATAAAVAAGARQ